MFWCHLPPFVGFLGCYGAIQESQCLLGTFFTCLVILFACEVAAGIWGFVNKDQVSHVQVEGRGAGGEGRGSGCGEGLACGRFSGRALQVGSHRGLPGGGGVVAE